MKDKVESIKINETKNKSNENKCTNVLYKTTKMNCRF